MVGKFLFFLSAATATFLGLSAGAVTTSKNVDIIVTHGAPLTTFTFVNNSGNTLPAGTPVSFGQGFRYGDIMPGTYPLIRDAITHTPLTGQQWDEISTWRENGGNGSWRHAVWAAWLPASLAAGATYQVEFVTAAGTYLQTSHQALSVLCSGPAAHDLKIHLTDVRNQNDSVRDSGDATFRVCDNINNAGRDAPRHLSAGNVMDEYVVSGMFKYTSGKFDPLLYAQCNIDLFTKSSDGTSAGDVRWMCHVHNSWMNVQANSTGNPGNPGPAGFTNDPQAISYRYEVDDGASVVLDQSNFDATILSNTNPVSARGANCASPYGEPSCMFVASSLGLNAWYEGQATRVSCTGACVGGLVNGTLYYVWPASSATFAPPNTQYVSMQTGPDAGAPIVMTTAQGTGTTTFSTRVQHYHFETFQTLDSSGLTNWSPFGTTTRVTRKLYPALTAGEKLYWQETGLVIPITSTQATPSLQTLYGEGLGNIYAPFAKGIVHGGGAGGANPDLGPVSEYAAKAWITQAEHDQDLARLFTLGTSAHGFATLLNEATGRMPVLNNGPPTGPGGNGAGGSYAGLGAPMNQVSWEPGGPYGIITPYGKPSASGQDIAGGTFANASGLDHMPSFDSFTYMLFGDRHFLDVMQWNANHDFLQRRVGPGPNLGQGYYRDNNARFTDGNTYHYWGLLFHCCQSRGATWLGRDVIYPAAFGADDYPLSPTDANNPERTYLGDLLTETTNYEALWLKFKDGTGNSNYTTSLMVGSDVIDGGPETTVFQTDYVANVAYIGTTFLHSPLMTQWNLRGQNFAEGIGGGQLYGSTSPYYFAGFDVTMAIHDGDGGMDNWEGNVGRYWNGTDGSDFGMIVFYMSILTGGQVEFGNFCSTCPPANTLQVGDKIKAIQPWSTYFFGPANLDQLRPATQDFEIMGPIDTVNGTFYIKCPMGHAVDATCPTPGAAFTGFTRGGVPVSNIFGANAEVVRLRPQYDPGPGGGYSDGNYVQYAGEMFNGLQILGYDVSHAQSEWAVRAVPPSAYYNVALPSFWWDPTVVVPGLPAVVTFSNQYKTLACGATAGTVVTSLGLIQGNGNTSSGWTILPVSSDPTHYAISGNNLVTAGVLPCNASQAIWVQGTQSGGGIAVTGQVHVHVNP